MKPATPKIEGRRRKGGGLSDVAPAQEIVPDGFDALRAQGRSWREITMELGTSKGTAQRALSGLPKNV